MSDHRAAMPFLRSPTFAQTVQCSVHAAHLATGARAADDLHDDRQFHGGILQQDRAFGQVSCGSDNICSGPGEQQWLALLLGCRGLLLRTMTPGTLRSCHPACPQLPLHVVAWRRSRRRR